MFVKVDGSVKPTAVPAHLARSSREVGLHKTDLTMELRPVVVMFGFSTGALRGITCGKRKLVNQ